MRNLLIVWTDINDTGIPIIDQQHYGIVSIINSLFFFIQHKQGNDILTPTTIMIEQYTKIHFATEEKLLKDTGYLDFDRHKKMHDSLIEQSLRIAGESKLGKDPFNYLVFLKNWWTAHINKQDRLFIDHLRSHMKEKV